MTDLIEVIDSDDQRRGEDKVQRDHFCLPWVEFLKAMHRGVVDQGLFLSKKRRAVFRPPLLNSELNTQN
jgi:hypothetical protein